MFVYLDTSALVKLVVADAESGELRRWIKGERAKIVSSALVRTELLRAVKRLEGGRHVLQAQRVLRATSLIACDSELLDIAGQLDSPGLRSLDAIHLASAMRLGRDLEGVITFDNRQAEAALRFGLPLLPPGVVP